MNLTEEMKAQLRAFGAEIVECETRDSIGRVRAWANSSMLDSHGSIIKPDEVIRLLTEASVPDTEHDFKRVDGVRFANIALAQRRVVDPKTKQETLVDGVSLTVECDLTVPEARSYYERFKSGVFKGLSIAFHAATDALKRWKEGATKVIEDLTAIPFVSAVSKPSNPLATVLEIRSALEPRGDLADADEAAYARKCKMRVLYRMMGSYACTDADWGVLTKALESMGPAGELDDEMQVTIDNMAMRLAESMRGDEQKAEDKPADDLTPKAQQVVTSTKTIDLLDALRTSLDEATKEVTASVTPDGSSPSREGDPVSVSSPSSDAQSSTVESNELAGLRAQVQDLASQVAALQATVSQSQSDVQARATEADTTTNALRAELESLRQRSDQTLELCSKIAPLMRSMVTDLEAKLRKPVERKGVPEQTIETRVAEEIASIKTKTERKSKSDEMAKAVSGLLVGPR